MTSPKGEGVLQEILGENFNNDAIRPGHKPVGGTEKKLLAATLALVGGGLAIESGRQIADHVQRVPKLIVAEPANNATEQNTTDFQQSLASAKAADADIFPPDGGVGK